MALSTTDIGAAKHMKTSEEIIRELESISPLALPQALIEYEIADMESSQELLEKVCAEFEDGQGVKGAFLEPMLLSMVDSAIRGFGSTKDAAKKYGLTASKIVAECKNFSYTDTPANQKIEETHINEPKKPLVDKDYQRKDIQKQSSMDKYKEEKFNGTAVVKDEYGSGQGLRQTKKKVAEDKRIKSPEKHLAETDHIVPLKNVHRMFEAFGYDLADETKKEIANSESNLALTTQELNRKKGKKSNVEVTTDKETKLPPGQKEVMRIKQFEATSVIAMDMTIEATKSESFGDLIAAILGPTWFEITDISNNGMCHNMDSENPLVALGMRMKRMLSYMIRKVPALLKGFVVNLWEMLKDVVFSLIASLFKKFVRVIKEGIKIFIEAVKILRNPSTVMSSAQKGDALLKLIGGFLTTFLVDIGLSCLIEKFIPRPSPWSDIMAGVVAAIAGAVFLYFLDKIDLFSIKSEMRLARVREIFDLRIKEIRQSAANFEIAAHETMKFQRIQFEKLRQNLNTAVDSKDMKQANAVVDNIANFFKVEIPYSSPEEFINFICAKDKIVIGI